jgi:hypothetical protein
MTISPRLFARYRAADTGETWDTRHYTDEPAAFVDETGRTWRRVALTRRAYTRTEAATRELDEAEEPARTNDAEDRAARGGW